MRAPRLFQAKRYHDCQRCEPSDHVCSEIYIYLSELIKLPGGHVTRIAMNIYAGTNLKYANEVTILKPAESRQGMSPLASEKLFAYFWRRRFVLLRVVPMIESERGIIFRSRNFDLQDSTRVLSLEKWVQCL